MIILFYNKYSKHSAETSAIDTVFGYEASLRYNTTSSLKSTLGFSYHKLAALESDKKLEDVNMQLSGLASLAYDLNELWQFDLFYRYLDSTPKSPKYHQLNLATRYQLNNYWRLSLQFKDLLKRAHVEPVPDSTRANSVIERRVLLKIDFAY